jgi:hypothetical protein
MEIINVMTKLSVEERETVLVYDNIDKVWRMDSTIPKHFNKAKKQGWKQITEFVYDDGTVCGGAFEAPEKAITIRDPNKKRVMSELQMQNLHKRDKEDSDDED